MNQKGYEPLRFLRTGAKSIAFFLIRKTIITKIVNYVKAYKQFRHY